MNQRRLRASLKQHEGLRLELYSCSAGKLTIGYGRNLSDNGITAEEAELLLANDIKKATAEAEARVESFPFLDAARQEVVVEMVFNLGWPRLAQFKRFLAALDRADYELAAVEMLDSRWAHQVGERATTLARKMRYGDANG